MTLLRPFLLIFALSLGLASTALADTQIGGKRVALVIGNGAYRTVEPLTNATNDARLIAETLRKLNFTLVGGGPQIDLDRSRMSAAVETFGHMLSGADVGLFYYSGHGLQVAGVNWLVPVDANPTRPKDLDFQMVDADLVLRQMDGAGTRLNLVLLDACRNNPFSIGGVRATQGGLAEMRAPEGTLIAYATQPGNVALDGDGRDSPYTLALARMMQQPGVDIFRMFNQVGLEVKRATGGSQQPWVSNSPIDGEFYFAGTPPPVAPPPLVATAPTVSPPAPEVSPAAPPPMQVAGLVRPMDMPPALGQAAPTEQVDPVLAIARERPCAILDARMVGDHVDLYGVANRGTDWDGFVRQVGAARGVRVQAAEVDFLPGFSCGVIDALGGVVRASLTAGRSRLATLVQRQILPAEALSVSLQGAAGKTVLLDIFRTGDWVDHVKVQPLPSGGGDIRVSIPLAADAPPGPRLLTAVISAGPLDLGVRPATERAGPYLAALREVVRTTVGARADLAVFELKAPPVTANVLSRTTATSSARCRAILEKAQMGEPVPDADRAFVREQCH